MFHNGWSPFVSRAVVPCEDRLFDVQLWGTSGRAAVNLLVLPSFHVFAEVRFQQIDLGVESAIEHQYRWWLTRDRVRGIPVREEYTVDLVLEGNVLVFH